jgi:hypothetical protein
MLGECSFSIALFTSGGILEGTLPPELTGFSWPSPAVTPITARSEDASSVAGFLIVRPSVCMGR